MNKKDKIIVGVMIGILLITISGFGLFQTISTMNRNIDEKVTNAIETIKSELEQEKENSNDGNVLESRYENTVNYALLGNSLKMFPSKDEAIKYAKQKVGDINSSRFGKTYLVYSMGYKDGVMQWTVSFL